jgi:hypothetical protein
VIGPQPEHWFRQIETADAQADYPRPRTHPPDGRCATAKRQMSISDERPLPQRSRHTRFELTWLEAGVIAIVISGHLIVLVAIAALMLWL